jgi:nitroreductase
MPNAVVTLLEARYATRSISPEPLAAEVIDELVEAARLTPSCFNKQPWRFLFLESEGARAKGLTVLADGNRAWAGRAPLLVLTYSRKENDCVMADRQYHQFDLGLSVMNLMLAATERQLVARPMAGFAPQKARELFGLDPADEPLVMIAVGRPSTDEDHLPAYAKGLDRQPRVRRPAGDIVQRL